VQVHQLFQPVVAVDDSAIQVVQIGGREPAASSGTNGRNSGGLPESRRESSSSACLPRTPQPLSGAWHARRFCSDASFFIFSRSSGRRFDLDALPAIL
jgi:hypothetical protein